GAAGARDLPPWRARGRAAVAWAAPVSAGHAADRGPGAQARGAVAQLRSPSPGVHHGARHRPAAGRDDDVGDTVHRSAAVSGGPILAIGSPAEPRSRARGAEQVLGTRGRCRASFAQTAREGPPDYSAASRRAWPASASSIDWW